MVSVSTYYDYYKQVCVCPGLPTGSAGKQSYYYDYYKQVCVCPGAELLIGMRDLEENEVGSFPVEVYNVLEELLGGAVDKQEYIDLWNSDANNQIIGTLMNAPGPFLFRLKVNVGQIAPPWVIGVPNDIELGIYGIEYGPEYE